jgi:hypothetical protein
MRKKRHEDLKKRISDFIISKAHEIPEKQLADMGIFFIDGKYREDKIRIPELMQEKLDMLLKKRGNDVINQPTQNET